MPTLPELPRDVVVTREQWLAMGGTVPPSTEQIPSGLPVIVPEESDVPPPAPGERDVWLTGWQVEEDHFDVSIGEHVAWQVVDAGSWTAELFGDRRLVHDDRDVYAEEFDRGPERTVAGTVIRIDQVSVRSRPTPDRSGRESVPGSAMQHGTTSIWPKVPHHGSIAGWVVRVRLDGAGNTPLSPHDTALRGGAVRGERCLAAPTAGRISRACTCRTSGP